MQSEGDLDTQEGRHNLFVDICLHRPRNVWFAPTCRPWCAWSQLNGSRSETAWQELVQLRTQHLVQVALGIVIPRWQRQRNLHMHWEQPLRSLMFKLPYFQEIFACSHIGEFDMCVVGDLKDPINHKPMKKAFLVVTTSQKLHEGLHNRKRLGNHDHQVIEGPINISGTRINRSQFSENYPRKFARHVCQILLKHWGLFDPSKSSKGPTTRLDAVFATDGEPPIKKQRGEIPLRATLKKPSVSEPPNIPCVKRRKLTHKQNPLTQKEIWEKIFRIVNDQAPRVGKITVRDSDILQQVNEVWPEKESQVVIVCRGTGRAIGPPKDLQKGEAPCRRCAFIDRTSGKIMSEDNWENRENLSQRQLIRGSHSCKLNITVFARNLSELLVEAQSHPGENPGNTTDVPLSPSESTTEEAVPQSKQALEQPVQESAVQIDRDSMKHGPKFLALPKDEQAVLLRAHKNLGHPSAERLMHLLRQQEFRPGCVMAIPDMKCSACEMSSRPKISRPSTIKDQMDFNDKIAVDCIKWTNSQGTSFHIMHIIDMGTSYHTACIAPSRTSSQAISNLIQTWFQWAGAPQTMIFDSGTEFNSEEFLNFLQSHGIKGISIAPGAHWQNGRSERHGQILESMLRKMDKEKPILSYEDLSKVLWFAVQAKNANSLRKGYAPEVFVFGKHTKIPGSITSDESLPAHCLADAETAQGIQFRKQLELREQARKAFWESDNDTALRRAILRRSRPERATYSTGEWIMAWRAQPIPGQWTGPMRVVTHENEHTVWVTMAGRLYRVAPENIRSVSALEAHQNKLNRASTIEDMIQSLKLSTQKGTTQFRDLNIPEDNSVLQTPPQDGDNQQLTPEITSSGPSSDQPDNEPDAGTSSETGVPDAVASDSAPAAVDIPVLESDDGDELICEDWSLTETDEISEEWLYQTEAESPEHINQLQPDQCWTLEVTIDQRDIDNWKAEIDPYDYNFLATAAKRQRSEVKMSELNRCDKALFDKAKDTEIQNWLKTGTVMKVLRNQLTPQEIPRCRWILTWKPIDPDEVDKNSGNPHPDKKAKARLVVLGYLDPNIDKIPRDSPTLGRHSKMLILQTIASRSWTVRSFDVKAAFLQGSVAGRTIGLEPVPDLAKALQLKPTEVCQLNKSASGLIDAPFLWYKALLKELLALGFQQAPFDPCVFTLRRPDSMMLSGGDAYFEKQIQALSKKYAFGSQKSSQFTFTGIDISQRADKGIVLSQSRYVRDISPIVLDPNRRSTPEEKVSEKERHSLRALIGSLQYAAVNTRPDLSSQLSHLQSNLIHANKTLHEAKRYHDLAIQIQPIPVGDLRFLAFSDASFSSKKVPDSHAGAIILATHQSILSNVVSPVSPISWSCKKIQKVVTSTLSAETMALDSTLDQMSWVRLFWAWIHDNGVNWKKPHESLKELPAAIALPTVKPEDYEVTSELPRAIAATDCKSLFDLVTKTAPPQCSEYRTQLHARSIKDLLQENVTLR